MDNPRYRWLTELKNQVWAKFEWPQDDVLDRGEDQAGEPGVHGDDHMWDEGTFPPSASVDFGEHEQSQEGIQDGLLDLEDAIRWDDWVDYCQD